MNKPRNQNKLLLYIGNFFTLLSIAGFAFTFYPIVRLYLFPAPALLQAVSEETFLRIPRINASAPVIEQVDPWNEAVYQKALQKGVAHAKGTALPGQNGTIFLFAHSSGLPWEITRYNTVFFRLPELKPGDEIMVVRKKREYRYKVIQMKEVWPKEVRYLQDTKKDQLIIQTCVPIGTSLKRLLVFADQIPND